MKEIMKRSLALVMALVICIGLMPATQFVADATGFEYVYDSTGQYIYNWGERGQTATSLSPNAEAFYTTGYTYDDMAAYAGGTGTLDAPNSELYAVLQKLMKVAHTRETTYAETRDLYQYTDCQKNGGKISSFYSGKEIGPAWDSGSTWNREHTWPNSKGLDGNDENDIMMLRPTATAENGARSNKAYGKSSGFYNPNSESNNALDLRGDVARIFLYIYVRWGNVNGNGQYTTWGSSGVIENLDVLLEWMAADPVDTWELGRNDSVQSITGTRNVFVDYPELAFLLFGAEVPKMMTPSGEAAGCGHNNFASVVTDPTCTEKGFTTYTCQTDGCGLSYKADFVDATAKHNYENCKCACGAEEPTIPSGGPAYIKITSLDALVSGQYVLIVSTGYAPGVVDGTWITAAQPVVENDIVTDTAGAVWTLVVDESGVTLMDANGVYIAPKGGNNNGIKTGTAYKWSVSCTDGLFQFRGTGSDTVGLASNTDAQYGNKFRGYKTTTISNAAKYPSQFTLYKLTEGSSPEPECQHTNTTVVGAVGATCTENGYTGDTVCSDCNVTVSTGTEISATGEHTYVNGVCTACGDTETTGPEMVYIKITSLDALVSGQYVLIVSTGYAPGVVDGTWITAAQPVVENDVVTDTMGAVWTLTVDANGVTIMDANGVYIAPKGGNNNGIKTGNAYSWSVSCADGLFKFSGTGSDTVALASNTDAQYGNKFRAYKNTTITDATKYPSQFALYKLTELGGAPEPECQHTNTTIVGAVDATCTQNGYTGDTVCSDCNVTVSTGTEISATGEHTYANGVCTGCGAEEPGSSETTTTYVIADYDIPDTAGEIIDFPFDAVFGFSLGNGVKKNDLLRVYANQPFTFTSAKLVSSIVLKASYKNGTFYVETSTDGTNWTRSHSDIAFTSTEADVEIQFETPAKYIRVIPAQQMRVRSITVTFVEEDEEPDFELTIPEAIEMGTSMDHNTYTEEKYYVTGVITEVYNTTYGNMKITDAEGNILTIYGTFNADGTVRYDAMETKPLAGDKVTIYGVVGQYNGVAQIKNGWIVEHTPAHCAHTNTELQGAKDATCTENGHTGNEVCTGCGVTVTAGNVIPATVHSFEDDVCTGCGKTRSELTLSIEEAIALGSSMEHNTYTENKFFVTGVITEVYNTTYGNLKITDAEGNILTIYGTYSADGNVRYDAMETKPVAGDTVTVYGIVGQYNGTAQIKNSWIVYCCKHENTEVVGAAGATCTENGYTGDTICTECGVTVTVGEEIAAPDHTEEAIPAKDATCTETGLTEGKKCSVCGEILVEQEETPVLEHTEEIIPGKAATCTETGLTEGKKCSVCGETLVEQEEIPVIAHALIPHDGKAPTCTENGWEAYETCENCNYTTFTEIAAGHAIVLHDGKAPTCTENGWEAFETCENCDYTTYTEIAAGHKYEAVATAPTCTEGGFTTHTCSVCGDHYVTDAVDALGHDMIHHEAKAPTCCENGWEAYEACSRCNHSTCVEIEATGHEYEIVGYIHEGVDTVIDFLDLILEQLERLEKWLSNP